MNGLKACSNSSVTLELEGNRHFRRLSGSIILFRTITVLPVSFPVPVIESLLLYQPWSTTESISLISSVMLHSLASFALYTAGLLFLVSDTIDLNFLP